LSSNRFLLATLTVICIPAACADPLTVFFIDPGYAEYSGDAMLVCTPDGGRYLIDGGDAGTDPAWDCGESRILPLLDSLGVSSLDGIVSTHPHSDHLGGLVSVLQALPVGRIWDSGWPYSPTPAYTAFLDAAEAAGIPFTVVRRGDFLDWGSGLEVEVLHPVDPLDPGSMNNASVVLRLTWQDIAFLFAGDIETEGGENLILEAFEAGSIRSLTADVLKVAHHGSTTSTSVAWLTEVDPVWAAIEVGAGNPYGHPHDEIIARMMARGIDIFRTDNDGTFYISTDGSSLYYNSLPPSGGQSAEGLLVYPSPCTGPVAFSWPGDASASALRVYNLMGELVFEESSPASPLEWDLSLEGGSLAAPGLYLAELDLADGTVWSECFAISR
jgi:beta-lactamase superfamily II metal-dependent hydrolase